MHLLKAFALFASSIHQLLWGRNNEKLFKVNNHLSSHNFKLRFSKNMPTLQKNHFGKKLRESRSPDEANSVFGGKDKVKLYRGFAPDIFRHKTTPLQIALSVTSARWALISPRSTFCVVKIFIVSFCPLCWCWRKSLASVFPPLYTQSWWLTPDGCCYWLVAVVVGYQ